MASTDYSPYNPLNASKLSFTLDYPEIDVMAYRACFYYLQRRNKDILDKIKPSAELSAEDSEYLETLRTAIRTMFNDAKLSGKSLPFEKCDIELTPDNSVRYIRALCSRYLNVSHHKQFRWENEHKCSGIMHKYEMWHAKLCGACAQLYVTIGNICDMTEW